MKKLLRVESWPCLAPPPLLVRWMRIGRPAIFPSKRHRETDTDFEKWKCGVENREGKKEGHGHMGYQNETRGLGWV